MFFLGRALGGKILDLYSKERIIPLFLVMSLVSMVILAFSKNLTMFIVVAVIWGIGNAFLTPAILAYIIDRADSSKGPAIGMYMLLSDLGAGAGTGDHGPRHRPQQLSRDVPLFSFHRGDQPHLFLSLRRKKIDLWKVLKKGLRTRIMGSVKDQPKLTVGVMDRQAEVSGRLDGNFRWDESSSVSGRFSAKAKARTIVLSDEANREVRCSKSIRLTGKRDRPFRFSTSPSKPLPLGEGRRSDLSGESYSPVAKTIEQSPSSMKSSWKIISKSVISSEMKWRCSKEFLKAHAILSRSWLLAALDRKKKKIGKSTRVSKTTKKHGEVLRWYEREDHDLFDVCADDHCSVTRA